MTFALLLALKLSIAALIFAIGMGSTPADIMYLLRRPGLLLRSLVAMYLVVPLVACVLVELVPLPPPARAALLVLAVSAGAPMLPRKLGTFGSDEYVFSLLVISSLLAAHFNVDSPISAAIVAMALAKAFLLPVAAGMVLRLLWPRLAIALSDRLMALAGAVLALSAVFLLVMHWQVFTHLGWIGMGALFLMMVLALLVGQLLGGPARDDRTALAIACSTRHIGIAILVASAFPGEKTAVLMSGYLVVAMAVSVPYLYWRRRPVVPAESA